MQKKMLHRSQPVAGAESTYSADVLVQCPTSDREAALASLSQQGDMRERPDWAPSDLEDIYCYAVESICEREDISWEAFISRAIVKFPSLPLVTTVRVVVTEYFRAAAGWRQEVLRPFIDGLHEQHFVGLMAQGLVSSSHAYVAGAVSYDCEVALQAQWD